MYRPRAGNVKPLTRSGELNLSSRIKFITGFIIIATAIGAFFLLQSRKHDATSLESTVNLDPCGNPRMINTTYALMVGKVTDVINGDTFVLVDEFGVEKVVHLIGIKAPTLKELVGVQSQEHLSKILLNKRVTIGATNSDDLQKEIVTALVSVNNESLSSVNLEQLKNGFAEYVEAGMSLDSYQSCEYKNAEQQAKINKLGIWLSR